MKVSMTKFEISSGEQDEVHDEERSIWFWNFNSTKMQSTNVDLSPMRNGQLGERYVPAAKISCKLTQNLSTHLQHRSSDRKVHLAFHRNVILPKYHRRYNRHGFTYLLFVFAVTNRLCKQIKESWCHIMMFLNSTQG